MREYALYLVVALLAIYAWRNWFVSCCALVLLMGVMQHEDMPKSIAGVQGLNLWNVLMLSVLMAWMAHRRGEGLTWDMPQYVGALLFLYALVIVGGFSRMMLDRAGMEDMPVHSLVSEELINTVKWVIPGLLIFDGCRSRKRVAMVLVSVGLLYVMLAAQVVKRMPPSSAWGGGGPRIQKLRIKTCAGIGYSVPDMSSLLAGGSWACLAAWGLCRKPSRKLLLAMVVLMVFYAQLLTGGRAGYLAWAVTGLVMCILRYRKYLLVAPLAPMLLYVVFPGTAQRMLQGFDTEGPGSSVVQSEYAITSGRNLIWPHVIEKIQESPVTGYGRQAMIRTGLRDYLGRQYGEAEAFPHPHNIYLEWLLDNGFVGLVPVLAFYGLIIFRAGALFYDRRNPWCAAVGGMALSVVLVQLVAGIGSQHFYPRESTVGMWAAAFLALRVHQEKHRTAAPVRASRTVAGPRPLRRGATA